MTIENEIQEKLKAEFGDKITDIKIPREHRIFVSVTLDTYKEVIRFLKQNFNMSHLTTITAIDAGENIEVLYHFFVKDISLNLRTFVPKAKPEIETITPIIPGAILYEREIQDLLGLTVKNHPDPRRLILPENWKEGVYPLRKEYKVPVESSSTSQSNKPDDKAGREE